MTKTRVLLLFGGRSSEHSISCVTAAGIIHAIDTERFDVIPVGVTRDGAMVLIDAAEMTYRLDDDPLPEVSDNGTRVHLPVTATSHEVTLTRADGQIESLGEVDIAFPLFHGPWGEDGTIQGLFELGSLPYVGCGVLASALCQDKDVAKTVFQAAGIAVAPWRTVTRETVANATVEELASGLSMPLFVKPNRAGSSVGVSRVTDLAQLPEALEVAFREDDIVLIEEGVNGREVEIAVLQGRGSQPPRTSNCIGEITFRGKDFYDFEAKYLGSDGVELVLPAAVTEAEFESLRDAATRAFIAVRGEGLARVDFFLTADGPVLNEINTLPGFTPISMFPQLWEHSGLAYRDLITELIELGLQTKRIN